MRGSRRAALLAIAILVLAAGCHGSSATAPMPASGSRCRPATAKQADLPRLDRLSLSAHQMELARPVRQLAIADGSVRRRLARQIDAARRFAAAVPTVREAKRRGYVLTLAPEAGSGAHWTDWSLVNCRFQAGRPSQILTAGTADDARVVALSYLVVKRGGPPRGFAGPNARWHRHFGLCLVEGRLRDRRDCAAAGRLLDGRDLWMLHAWVVPDWENPWGIFVPLNPRRLAAAATGNDATGNDATGR